MIVQGVSSPRAVVAVWFVIAWSSHDEQQAGGVVADVDGDREAESFGRGRRHTQHHGEEREPGVLDRSEVDQCEQPSTGGDRDRCAQTRGERTLDQASVDELLDDRRTDDDTTISRNVDAPPARFARSEALCCTRSLPKVAGQIASRGRYRIGMRTI